MECFVEPPEETKNIMGYRKHALMTNRKGAQSNKISVFILFNKPSKTEALTSFECKFFCFQKAYWPTNGPRTVVCPLLHWNKPDSTTAAPPCASAGCLQRSSRLGSARRGRLVFNCLRSLADSPALECFVTSSPAPSHSLPPSLTRSV